MDSQLQQHQQRVSSGHELLAQQVDSIIHNLAQHMQASGQLSQQLQHISSSHQVLAQQVTGIRQDLDQHMQVSAPSAAGQPDHHSAQPQPDVVAVLHASVAALQGAVQMLQDQHAMFVAETRQRLNTLHQLTESLQTSMEQLPMWVHQVGSSWQRIIPAESCSLRPRFAAQQEPVRGLCWTM